MAEHPLDLGLILSSASDSIWEEEVARHDGLQAVAKAVTCDCSNPDCRVPHPRKMVQAIFKDQPDFLLEVAQQLSPHVAEDRPDLYLRFRALVKSLAPAPPEITRHRAFPMGLFGRRG